MKKTCFVCNVEKDITEFYKHSAMKDGYLNKCKNCCVMQAKEHRALNIEKIRAYDRNRPNKKERTQKSKEYKTRMRVEDPEKYDRIFHGTRKRYRANYKEKCYAEGLVNEAIRNGKLKRPEACEVCKTKCKVQAHHPDYSKPLEVMWLCVSCHAKEHNKIRELERQRKRDLNEN